MGMKFNFVHASYANRGRQYARSKILATGPGKLFNRKIMSSPPVKTSGDTPTLPIWWPANYFAAGVAASGKLTGAYFNYVKSGNISPVAGSSIFVNPKNIKKAADSYANSNMGVLLWHDGKNIEFVINFAPSWSFVLFKIDNEYVTLTPDVSSGVKYVKLAFPTRARRKIEIIMGAWVAQFGGVYTDAFDSVEYCHADGPKCVIVGDSFASGIGATQPLVGMSAYLSDYMGWDNVLYDAIPGTGYYADDSGNSLTYRQRMNHNVIDQQPDVVIVTGGVNDFVLCKNQSEMYTEAFAYFTALKKALPNVMLIACAPFWYTDVSGYHTPSGNIMIIREGIKQAAVAAGALWIDLLESRLPIDPASPLSGTLSNNISAGSATFQSASFFPAMSTVEIGRADRVLIGGVSGSGPYTYTLFSGTVFGAHSIGEEIKQVGNGFWRGDGNTGSPSTVGNCSLYVCADGVHPSDAGHSAIAHALSAEIFKTICSI